MKKIFLFFFIIFIATNYLIAMQEGKSVVLIDIKNNWQFKQAGTDKWYPALVPGCVHTDLISNKLIDDPYFGTNEQKLQWIGEKDWSYQTTFDVDNEILKKKNVEMIFKGLDTYAEVFLNDQKILSADNMFREWKVDCKNLLKPKDNLLRINFRNVFDENLPKYNNAPYRLMTYDNNDQADVKINMYSRKAGFHFGWDWGPRFITYGIWRPIFIEGWDGIKLNDVQIVQKKVSKQSAEVKSNLEIFSDIEQNSSIKIFVNGKELAGKNILLKKGVNKVALDLVLENPRLWWTNGLGEQYLYNFEYKIISKNNITDEKKYRIGIRSVEMVREKDSVGTSFYFRLNGVPVFAKGANYIPQDNFQNRVTSERHKYLIKSAADANMNILRIWGGGIYEDDLFYDLCDEYGILVWQEFAFACGMYPVDEKYLDNVRHEVIDNVKRLRNHSCLAMYCGNNENEIAWFQWGWKQKYSVEIQKKYETDYRKLFYETIPTVLKEVDSTRYYHPSSPSSSYGNFSFKDGDAHYWSVWHGKEPFEKFNDNIARFMSEYGFQSYPEMNAVKKFTNPEDRKLHSEVMLSHQRCMSDERRDKEYGNRLIQSYMEKQFRQPKDFENYIYVAQVLQAEGIKMAIEVHRRNMLFCMGTMFWQIDDCWPVASWSSIDYYGNWKALHYYTKKAYEQVHVSPYLKNDVVEFFIISDKLEPVNAVLEIKTIDFNGKDIFAKKLPIVIKANSSSSYLNLTKEELINGNDDRKVFVEVKIKSGDSILSENSLFFRMQKDLLLEKSEIKMKQKKVNDVYEIELSTDKLARNVFLSIDDTEGFFTDNYFDLAPGTIKKIEFRPKHPIESVENKIKIISLIDSF